jgi:glycosyltransferase involved in cell wall biosynthesis
VKIAFGCAQLSRSVPGGIGTYINGVLKELKNLNRHDLEINCVDRVWTRRDSRSSDFKRTSNAEIVIRNCFSQPFDIVHSSSFDLVYKGRAKQSIMVHDLFFLYDKTLYTNRGYKFHLKKFNECLETADCFMCPSDYVKNQLEENGVDKQNIVVIPEGADHLAEERTNITDNFLSHLGLSGPFILTVGTLEPRKNLDNLIKGFLKIRKEINPKPVLLVVGQLGWKHVVKSYPGVIYTKTVNPEVLTGLYRRATCFIYAPLFEGFGLPPLEAMSCSTPVVCSPVPSVKNSDAAIFVDPNDPESIANGILTAAENKEYCRELVKKADIWVKKFTWGKTAYKHIEVWHQMLNVV